MMAKKMKTLISITLFVICASKSSAAQTGFATASLQQPAPPQTSPRRLALVEAVRTALVEHPGLRQAREAISAAQARTKQAKSGYYPQLSASGIAKQGLSGASGALGLRGLVTSPLFRDIGASAAAFQNIYDFGRTSHQVKASRWATVSLNHALEAQQALVALNVQQAYYTALGQQRLVKVAEQTLAERQLVVRQASAFYKAEIKSKVDLTLAEVNASAANLELVKSRDLLSTAFAELNHAMGVEGEAVYTLEEPDGRIESPPSLETLLTGSKQRPELLALEAQINADDEFIARARSDRWPKLMALLSSGWVRFSDLSPGKLLLGAFGIDLPIFTGGRLEAEAAEAKANLEQTRAARDKLAQDIRLQIQRGHNQLLTAIESVRASEHLVTQAREALRLAQVRYRVQIGSFVELTSGEIAAANAEAQHAEALYKYKMAEAALNFAAGGRVNP